MPASTPNDVTRSDIYNQLKTATNPDGSGLYEFYQATDDATATQLPVA